MAFGGIAGLDGRRGYFLGSVGKALKSVVSSVAKPIKKVVSSPIGQAALIAGGGLGLANIGPFGRFS